MFTSPARRRPRNLTAVYLEPRKIEVVRAHREWRHWRIDSTEQFPIEMLQRVKLTLESETALDVLQHLRLKPPGKHGSALVLFLPGIYYNFHREVYPSTLKDRLDEALTYDWQENIFYEHERALYFFSSPIVVNHHVSVPIFSIQRDKYEKFQQVLGAESFQQFAIIPSALAYGSYLGDATPSEEPPSPCLDMVARMLDDSKMEIHRFYKRTFLDSVVVNRDGDDLALFRQTIKCIGESGSDTTPEIKAVCSADESADERLKLWHNEQLPIRIHPVRHLLISDLIEYFFGQEEVRTFEAPLFLKPWEVPKIAWYLLGLVMLFLIFTSYQFYSLHHLRAQNLNVKKQVARLEAQWKPIEQLQTRISKFQEDRKTLSEFKKAGYPLPEILTLLTRITPEDTWVNYLSLRSGQLILRGESKSAIKYLSDLSKVDGFTDVRFASPVTRNPSSDLERFNLQLQVDSDKIKKTADDLLSGQVETKPATADAVEADGTASGGANKAPAGRQEHSTDQGQTGSGPVAK
jgi:Tfp pilus assembly protein PilN